MATGTGFATAAAVALFALAGCMSTDDLAGPAQPGMNASGTYPSLGKPLEAATTQMSDAEAADMGQKLQALANARKSGAISESEYERKVAEMQKLAKDAQAAATTK